MIAVDTNVLVRAIVGDDAAQAATARRWLKRAAGDGILADPIVLCELVWVLRARYGQSREAIVAVLDRLLETSGVVVPDEDAVRAALAAYRDGRGDFADHLIRVRAEAAGAARFLTFDAGLRGVDGVTVLR